VSQVRRLVLLTGLLKATLAYQDAKKGRQLGPGLIDA